MKKHVVIAIILTLDILILFVFTALGNIFFGWQKGGGMIPQIILCSVIVLINRILYRRLYKIRKIDVRQSQELKEMTDSMPIGNVIGYDKDEFMSEDMENTKTAGNRIGCILIVLLIVLGSILVIAQKYLIE